MLRCRHFCIIVRTLTVLKLLESNRIIEVPWRPKDIVHALLVVLLGILGILFLLIPALSFLGFDSRTSIFLFAFFLEAILLITALRFGPYKYKYGLATLGLRKAKIGTKTLPYLVLVASIGLSYIYISTVVATGAEWLQPRPLPTGYIDGILSHVAIFTLLVLLAPIAEEVFFRGFLLPVLTLRWGFLAGSGITSLLFAASHGDLGMIVPAFGAGMLFAWLYHRTRSLWSCIIAHGIQNLLAFAVIFIT